MTRTEVLNLETLGLHPEATAALPDGVRRQLVRFLLRWAEGRQALSLLSTPGRLPRDRYDYCRALVAAGELVGAQEVSRELVNDPDAPTRASALRLAGRLKRADLAREMASGLEAEDDIVRLWAGCRCARPFYGEPP